MTLDWASKQENRSHIEYGNRENGREEAYPVSVPVAAVFSRFFFIFLFFPAKMVYGWFIRDTVPVGTGFSRPLFIPSD